MKHYGGALKPREERRRTVLPARIRSGAGWDDACILNVSSRGLMLYTTGAAKPGTVIEVRRGAQIVIARVVWRQNRRLGVASQGEIPVSDIVSNAIAASAAASTLAPSSNFRLERRRHRRWYDRSRYTSRAFEFASIVLAGAVLGGIAAVWVEEALTKPLALVTAALHAH
jgi:hypothetical protein